MKLAQLVPTGGVQTVLKAHDRDLVIAELVALAASAGVLAAEMREEIVRMVMDRERRGSTGFGRGVAVPHVKLRSLHKTAVVIGLSQRGIDFSALDKQPVYSVFLLLSPEHRPDDHLHAMEVIFKGLGNERFRRLLRQATSDDEVRRLLEESDAHTV
jgi:mannitol/fructose-specific phosphotransferase system IIA component (Ntr-type)